ncbi:hypothetical protein [Yinghuangia seranimata]|uniref:hypothetical protein n=1 Tax=Yinghuangia seranimata TaxID=408067 RepID=UPI00248B45E0|nr:hypothetical protein [Yinghuangia seranimata]MDI2131318.1 hypothetical protein [Yinghuangia seranimata]
MQAREPEAVTTVSPRRITAVRWRRGRIFPYSDADVAAIVAAATETIPQPLQEATYRTLIGLLAAAGLRVGEASNSAGKNRDSRSRFTAPSTRRWPASWPP